MKLTFTPMRHAAYDSLEKDGDALVINGERFDFAALPEGAHLPQDAVSAPWFTGPVSRQDGALCLSLLLPHGPDAPQATLFPDPLMLTADGPVVLPPYDRMTDNAD